VLSVPRRLSALCLVLVLAALVAVSVAGAKEPKQPATPAQIVAYHDSGQWDRTISKRIHSAKRFIRKWLRAHRRAKRKPAAVLDIDDTSVSLYECAKAVNFGPATLACAVTPPPPVIPQTLSFYRFAQRRGVRVFFITGRPESLRALTQAHLNTVGYTGNPTVYLKPPTYTDPSVIPYKAGARRDITRKGYRILVNIGDQRSDLKGGYALRKYKLPNPMYFTP
jgi:predicted secreted acid phosphatase